MEEETVSLCVGELLHCEKSLNALKNKRILQNGLLPTNDKLLSERNDQQDDALVQRSGLRICFGQSPDLNQKL